MPPPESPPQATRRSRSAVWILLLGLGFTAVGFGFQDRRGDRTEVIPTMGVGGTSDSNGRMIAVTGVDVTGQSILYLVDTVSQQLAVYQASGGAPSTQGVKFVGARNIGLDLRVDGFNDKTESNGRPLTYKDMAKAFEKNKLPTADSDR